MQTTRHFALLSFAGAVLVGCIENEKSCYDRLRTELESSNAILERRKDDASLSSDLRIQTLEAQMAILVEKSRLSQLFSSESVSVCDFYLDGDRLIKK
jgi:hypothetical protein